MYVLKLCYEVLKLEVNNSVAGGDFFPVIFRLINLICNVWLVKLINFKLVLTCEPVKLISAKKVKLISNKKHVLSLIWLLSKISRKKLF